MSGEDITENTVEFVEPIKVNPFAKFLSRVWAVIVCLVTYFSKQRRFDRAQMKIALTSQSLATAKRAREAYWKAKREKGNAGLKIQHGGTITTEKPFPARGSLLTQEERNDPLRR